MTVHTINGVNSINVSMIKVTLQVLSHTAFENRIYTCIDKNS